MISLENVKSKWVQILKVKTNKLLTYNFLLHITWHASSKVTIFNGLKRSQLAPVWLFELLLLLARLSIMLRNEVKRTSVSAQRFPSLCSKSNAYCFRYSYRLPRWAKTATLTAAGRDSFVLSDLQAPCDPSENIFFVSVQITILNLNKHFLYDLIPLFQ